MAHAAALNALAAGLITSILGPESTTGAFRKLRSQTLQDLKDQKYPRTNQFAVKESLEGLIEKFIILNRDDLGGRLAASLAQLPTESQWTPENLLLLLQLSDRPVEKTSIEDVENANPCLKPESPLTWNDILAVDPFDEPLIWDVIDRGYHSSGNEVSEDAFDDESGPSTRANSPIHERPLDIAISSFMKTDSQVTQDIKAMEEFWLSMRENDSRFKTTEYMVIRDMLSMLRGLSTCMFNLDSVHHRVTISRAFCVAMMSQSTLSSVLEDSAVLGTRLCLVRQWTTETKPIAYLQAIQGAISTLLMEFEWQISVVEKQMVHPTAPTVVSVVGVLTELQKSAACLTKLSNLIQTSSSCTSDDFDFTLLNLLYDEICTTQISGNRDQYRSLSKVFYAGLQSYLREVTAWIETGKIGDQNSGLLFVADVSADCSLGSLWHSRFEFRTRDGKALAPKCIFPFAYQMFTSGKSRSFLHLLEHVDESAAQALLFPSNNLVQGWLCELSETNDLVPFSQLLSRQIEKWLSIISTDNTLLLRNLLWENHSLAQTLQALPFVFFSRDGSLFQAFAEILFDHIRRISDSKSISNEFLLTEVLQTTIGYSREVSTESLYLTIQAPSQSMTTSVVQKLGCITAEYNLSWPLQNVFCSQTLESHSKVFVLLLQLSYAASILQPLFFNFRLSTDRPSRFLALRRRLLCFIDILQTHIIWNASALHSQIQSRMKAATDIDGMVGTWATHEAVLQMRLLVADSFRPMHDTMLQILELSEALVKTSRPSDVADLQAQYDSHVAYLVPGIREASRACGDHTLDALIDRLEWISA